MKFLRLNALRLAILFILTLFLQPSLLAEEGKMATKLKLKKDGKDWLELKITKDKWKGKSPNETIKIKEKKNKFKVETSRGKYKIKKNGEKIKVKTEAGAFVFKLKKKDTGWKIFLNEEGTNFWKIKSKGENIYKVKKWDSESGKLKFKSEKGKIKAKDVNGKVMCTMKLQALSMAPAVCLMSELTEERKLLLFSTFILFGL